LEFSQRAKQIAQKQNAEVTKKQQSPKPTTAKTARRINVIRRGEKLAQQSQTAEEPILLKQFEQKDVYVPDTVMYSTYDPQDLFALIQETLKETDAQFTASPKKTKLVF
jgi:hypothetical protein